MRVEAELEKTGKHYGHVRISHSTDHSAYGWISIPVISIKGVSAGPTVLGIGGNHGDEYEGQIAWLRIARAIDPADVNGQLILFPALNLPAALAGTRVSPLDNVNLNRCFPGSASGTPTQQIAHLIETEFVSRADHMIDLHSGGASLDYLAGPTFILSSDTRANIEALELAIAFGAPQAYFFEDSAGGAGSVLGACRRGGVKRMGAELGGAGRVSIGALEIAEVGTLRALAALGVIDPSVAPAPAHTKPRLFYRGDVRSEYFVRAPRAGLFQPLKALGDVVCSGEAVALLWTIERPEEPPLSIESAMSGTVICIRPDGRAIAEDCLFVLGTDLDEAAL